MTRPDDPTFRTLRRIAGGLAVLSALGLGGAPQRWPPISPEDLPAGLGVAVVAPVPGGVLGFYDPPEVGEIPGDRPPVDRVLFGAGEPSVAIAEAPPWLVPEFLKMDYEIFHFRVVALTRDWMEVVGNSLTGQTWWLRRDEARFVAWPEFLLDISAVEAFDPAANPVRSRPLDQAGILADAVGPLSALGVSGDWLKVSIHHLADRMPPEGWIRWRDGERLLVRYVPLS